jgi:hypothetical protein
MGQEGKVGTEIALMAVYSGSEENKKHFQYTPNGSITLGILNPDTAAMFEVGKDYYVDFTPAN